MVIDSSVPLALLLFNEGNILLSGHMSGIHTGYTSHPVSLSRSQPNPIILINEQPLWKNKFFHIFGRFPPRSPLQTDMICEQPLKSILSSDRKAYISKWEPCGGLGIWSQTTEGWTYLFHFSVIFFHIILVTARLLQTQIEKAILMQDGVEAFARRTASGNWPACISTMCWWPFFEPHFNLAHFYSFIQYFSSSRLIFTMREAWRSRGLSFRLF